MSLADAFVEVKPDTRNFGPMLRRDLRRIDPSSAGREHGSRYGRGFTGVLGGVGVKAVGLLTGALGGAVGLAGVLGVKTAAANENAEIAFTTMLKSGDKAKAFLKDLQDFAAATPFEFDQLQTAASSLISIGINADKVIPIMTTLGDVTSGMGTGAEGVRRATVALQQMNAAGRITAEDLNQLRDAGVPVFDLLAAATNKSKKEVAELARTGGLGAKELGQLMKALESGEGLERFAGLMDKQSQSLGGLWSTFKDVASQGLAKAIGPVVPILKEGLAGATTALAAVLPKMAAGLKLAAQWFANLVKEWKAGEGLGGRLRAVFERVAAAVGNLIEEWKAGEGVGGALREVMERIAAAIGSVVQWMSEHTAVMGPLLKIVLAVVAALKVWSVVQGILNIVLMANPIGLIIAAIAALVAIVVLAYKKSDTFRAIVDGAFKAIKVAAAVLVAYWKNVLWPALKFVFEAIGTAAGWLWEHAIKPAAKGIRGAFEGVGKAMSAVWTKVLKPTFQFLVEAFLTVAGKIVEGAAKAFGWVPGLGPKLKEAAKKFGTFKDDVNKALDKMDDKDVVVKTKFRATYGLQAGGAEVTKETRGLALGGLVPRTYGSIPHKDSVNAMLVPGEYVIREDGSNLGDAIAHFATGFAKGGLVPKVKTPSKEAIEDVVGYMKGTMADDVAPLLTRLTQSQLDKDAAERGGAYYGRGLGNTLARVLGALLSGLTITSTYRSPAANAAAGGYARSYHMDRANPAVDIGGPTSLLDAMFARLLRMGGWRELLWRVPGHYDHVHVADEGALLRPGALGLNLSGRSERVLSPEQTAAFERMVAALESEGVGSARTLVLVDQDGALIGRMRAEAGDVLDEELAAARWGDS